MRKEIMDSPWEFILYEGKGERILDVDFCKSFIDYSRKFKLEKKELNYDFEELKKLSEDIRNNHEKYKDREIKE